MPCRTHALLALLATSCTLGQYDGPRFHEGDVAFDPPLARSGDALHVVLATSVDLVIAELAHVTDDLAAVTGAIAGAQEHARDGGARVYGPFDDLDGRAAAWIVAATPGERTSRFAVSIGPVGLQDAEQAERVADIAFTQVPGERRGAWTLWPGRYAARLGPEGSSPVGRALTLEFTVAGDGARTLSVTTAGAHGDVDVLGPVYQGGIELATAAEGSGWLRMPSAVALPDTVLAVASETPPSLAVAWTPAGEQRIVARVRLPDADVFVEACYDDTGAAVFRGVRPPAMADPQYALGDGSACAISASAVPVPH